MNHFTKWEEKGNKTRRKRDENKIWSEERSPEIIGYRKHDQKEIEESEGE